MPDERLVLTTAAALMSTLLSTLGISVGIDMRRLTAAARAAVLRGRSPLADLLAT